MSLPLSRFLNAIYMWCVDRIAEDDLERFKFELEKPTPGAPESAVMIEQEQEAFAEFASAFGVLTPPRG